jgi:hypothetical protein
MRTWKEVISEATAAETRKAGQAALKQIQAENKKDEKTKKKSDYTKYLKKQLEFKKQKYEDQKKAQVERVRQKGVQQHVDKAKSSISGIKTQQISDKEGDATAYSKAIGNVGSAAAGVAGAAYHGTRALLAKRSAAKKAAEVKANQIEKKQPKAGGRPSAPAPATPGTGAPKPTGPVRPSIGNVTGPASNPKRPTGPVRPSIGNVTGPASNPKRPKRPAKPTRPSIGNVTGPASNPKRPNGMRTEEYSNWREEFLYEVETEKKNTKGKKKDIVDVMPKDATNKIDLNPNEGQVKESIEKEPIEKENPGMNVKKKQQLTQQIMLQKKIEMAKMSQLNKGIPLTQSYEVEGNSIDEEGPVLSVGRGEKLSVERGGGLTQKGRDKYNRATGSHLQAPVTGDVKPGSKAAQRRKNFCSRSRSWKGERGLAARRRWKC